MISNLSIVNKDYDNTNYNLNEGQKIATDGIIDFIAEDFNPNKYIVGLTGPGGVGKTYVTKYIISKCKYSHSVIKCTAPTHKACRVFSDAIAGKQVDTIQSTFGLRLNMKLEEFNPNKPQFDPMAKVKLDNIKVLVIDESSMLPAKMATYIKNKCKELQVKIIFIGDPYQLAPVNEKRSIAFDLCYIVYDLTEIVRQGADNPIGNMLKMLRYDIQYSKYTFLEYISKNVGNYNYNSIGEGYSIMNPKDFQNKINNSFSNENYTKNIDMYRIIAYTNPVVSSWNGYIRNSIILNADKNIVTKNDLIMSYETIVNEFMEIVINNSEEYIINDISNYVDEDYGFKGFLVKFQLVHGGTITRPLFIVDHRDQFTIMKYHKVISAFIGSAKSVGSGTRVNKWKEYYAFKKKYLLSANIIDVNGDVLYTRDIDYGFSITAHKSQGSTYDNVFVDVNNMVYSKYGTPYSNQDDLLRRLYVACSRTKKELILSFGK